MKYKNMHATIISKNNQSGFSLVELFLVISVSFFIIAGLFSLFQTAIDDRTDARVAAQISELQNVSEDYVSLNFQDMIAVIPTVGDVVEIPILDLQIQNFLTVGYSGINVYRQQMRVYIRNNTDAADSGDVIEVLTLSDDIAPANSRMSNGRLLNAANKGGPSVGTITNIALNAGCCVGSIVGSSKTWSVPLAPFAAAATPYNAVANADGGYLAAYGRVVDPAPINNNSYLFREPIPAIIDANVMNTNLDMNGNQIDNASIIVTDSIEMAAGNDFTINGNGTNLIQSPYVLAVENDMETINLQVEHSVSSSSAIGSLFIDGDNGGVAIDLTANQLDVNHDSGNSFIIAQDINDDADGLVLDVVDQMNITTWDMQNGLTVTGSGSITMATSELNNSSFSTSGVLQIYNIEGSINTIETGSASIETLSVTGDTTINIPTNVQEPVSFPNGASAGQITAQGYANITNCIGACN